MKKLMLPGLLKFVVLTAPKVLATANLAPQSQESRKLLMQRRKRNRGYKTGFWKELRASFWNACLCRVYAYKCKPRSDSRG